MNKYSKDSDVTYVLGISLIIEALKKVPKEIIEVYLSNNIIKNNDYDLMISLCRKNNINFNVNDKVINDLSTKENCYGIALINKYKNNISANRHLILKDFNDEGELGTIIRSMASFNYKDLVLINSNIDIYNPKVIRSSMGGFFHVNISMYNSLDDYLKCYNVSIVKIGLKGDKELKHFIYNKNTSIMIGDKNNDYYINHLNNSNINLSSICTIVLDFLK